ncbi:MAG TPA: hypothetical protein DIT04_11445 [Dysgonomonas sp.]|nr:hypothetical protein [Dysgonomonas sp.]
MKNYFTKISFYLFAAIAMVGITTSCSSDDDDDDTPPPAEDLKLEGQLSTERRLLSGNTYDLIGGYEVLSGGNLIIEEGVTIRATRSIDGQPDYIIVMQGGKIQANGTKEKPIVMTSTRQEPGAWGGLHICGKAPVNLSGGTGKAEIDSESPYGGNDPSDNSGTIRYVRLEYTGFAFHEEKESNGLTMYGVGNGTTVEYVQTYKGADDGFEWFGGTVNGKYLVSTHSEDDSFDWTEGWVGKGQFWVAVQDPTAPGSDGTANGDCLIEADNSSTNSASTPVSCPTLSNLTLIGNNDTNAQQRGIRLRAGTYVKLYNTLVKGKPKSITTQTNETEQSFVDGKSELEYVWVDKGFTYESGASLGFESKTGNAIDQTIDFSNSYIGVIEGGKDLSSDSFFTKAEYKGAVPADNDWTAGWTRK